MNLVYKNENVLKIIALLISLAAWAAILWFTKGLVLLYVALFGLVYVFAQSGFISHLKGTGVRVSPEQYPDLSAALHDGCQKLQLDSIPECYVLRMNVFNALATRFFGRSFVVLYAEVLDALKDRTDALAFYIGHELGHLKRKHLQWHAVLLPATFLPLLAAGYRRAQEYTCDRHGLACTSPGGAQTGLLAIATAGSRLPSTNVSSYIAQSGASGSFWMSFHELISDYPWLTKRMAEVTAASSGGAASHPRRNFFAWLLAAIVPRLGVAGAGAGPLVMIAMIGVLAAIAIPAYQDYTIRSQVTEGLNLAAGYKAAVAEARAAGTSDFNKINSQSLAQGLPTQGTYVKLIEVQSGAVVITYGGAANPALQNHVLVLVPVVNEKGDLGWACGYSTPPAGYEAIFEDHGQYSDVPPKYLPVACRGASPVAGAP